MRRLLAFAILLSAAGALAQAPTQRIRGDVSALDGSVLTVKARSGETLTVKLADNYTVAGLVAIDRAALVDGAYIGTASLPRADGTLAALEILVFPDAMRGAGEGHGPWDLQPGSQMTNATIARVQLTGSERQLTLRYKDGEKTVVVPEGVPIVTFEPGERALLVPGAHIILTAAKQPDGTLTATRVTVGKNGLVPPM
jgi:hypothetical protein